MYRECHRGDQDTRSCDVVSSEHVGVGSANSKLPAWGMPVVILAVVIRVAQPTDPTRRVVVKMEALLRKLGPVSKRYNRVPDEPAKTSGLSTSTIEVGMVQR